MFSISTALPSPIIRSLVVARAGKRRYLRQIMKRYFTDHALLRLRSEIQRAGGNEVFFLGTTDETKMVIDVEPLARGNRDAVAAIMITASFGDVVIHNHPSGDLTPSQADVSVSSLFGNRGVGFYLIDNGATRCNPVIPPFSRRQTVLLSFPELEELFRQHGLFARTLPNYELRDEQLRMCFTVAEAFNTNRISVIEAGTGTGKSLAYLVPAVYWSLSNKERVVISTNTINLQEQLVRKDLPFLRSVLTAEFSAVLVKGRSNYLCLRKLEAIRVEPSLLIDDHAADLQAISEWSQRTADGCKSDLGFIPRDEVWEQVACESDQCTRAKCPWYSKCFFYSARREAAAADLLVVNHSLLLADVSVRAETGYESPAVLPPFSRIIFDEGHHLEDVATSFLSVLLSRQSLLKQLSSLQHPRKAQKGLFPLLSGLLSTKIPEELDALYMELSSHLETVLVPHRQALSESTVSTFDAVTVHLQSYLNLGHDRQGEFKLRLTEPVYESSLWIETQDRLTELSRLFDEFSGDMRIFLLTCDRLPEAVQSDLSGALIDLKGIQGRLRQVAEGLTSFIRRDDDQCRWFELRLSPKGSQLRLRISPLDVAHSFKTAVLDRFRTVVITSATLAVGGQFHFLKNRIGLDRVSPERLTELLLPSPFDYRKQTFVGIPTDIPEPTARGFDAHIEPHVLRALLVSQGRAFVLFTSYDLLRKVYDRCAIRLSAEGLTPLRQGEVNRHALLSRFRSSRNAVLFGTDSFWEGVDVKGRALELVIITRLPFKVPSEPVLEARAEAISARGGDPFMEYTVPQAVIKFKQGFGRLIRSHSDRGAVLIFDSRVLNRPYGRIFLKSLPQIEPVSLPGDLLYRRMADFFASSDSPLPDIE